MLVLLLPELPNHRTLREPKLLLYLAECGGVAVPLHPAVVVLPRVTVELLRHGCGVLGGAVGAVIYVGWEGRGAVWGCLPTWAVHIVE